MKKIIFTLCLIGLLSSCADDKNARRILENNGYKDIRITGYKAYCCSDDDQYSTGFTATNQNGVTVSGCVCTGFSKGGTIRFE
ncbi:MAG: hypothetical protein ACJ75J_16410 [Cytophagaceae bacterium]|jgi:hypothetical protein